METSLTTEQKEAALFKGLYIDRFIQLENALERVIVQFFQVQPYENVMVPGLNNKDETKKQNEKFRYFLDHSLFIDKDFGTKQRIESFQTVLKISNGKLYKQLRKNTEFNYFELIITLSQVRNLFAHNAFLHHENIVYTWRRKSKFRGVHTKERDSNGKIIVDYSFDPVFDFYTLSDEMKKIISRQMTLAYTFVRVCLDQMLPENHPDKQFKDSLEWAKAMGGLDEAEEVHSKIGVYALVKDTFEKPIRGED